LSSPWGEETGAGGRKKQMDWGGHETLKEKLKPYLQTRE